MARKKRLNTELVLSNSKSISEKSIKESKTVDLYNTALYVRLSVEDSGKTDGYSMENQIILLKNYILDKAEFKLYKIYADNGQSGVNFERPAFNEMMADVRAGIINCIIVKDLSRLGRNYLETGQYIEQIFPFFHVRFISVMDNYDSISANATDAGMLIPLKNIINESYAKDISMKVSSAMKTRQKKGIYLGNYPPYGYQKDPAEKGHLVIDENVADHVRQMFQWKADGLSTGKIAKKLNDAGVLSPYRYFYNIGLINNEKHKDSLWTRLLVKRLLEKRYYVGDMVAGTERSSLAEGIKKQKVDRDELIIVEGTHEPLVSRELFDDVQAKLNEDKCNYNHTNRYEGFSVENLYKGKLRCGNCGNAMKMNRVQIKKENGTITRRVEYICIRFAEHKFEDCKSFRISKEDLDRVVYEEIKAHIMIFANAEQILRLLNSTPKIIALHSEYEKVIQNKVNRLTQIENLTSSIYEDFKDEVIDEQEYLGLRKTYFEEANELKRQVDELEIEKLKYSPKYSADEKCRRLIGKYFGTEVLTRDLIETFIECITVLNDRRIQITYKFQDEFQNILDELNRRKCEVATDECSKDIGYDKALCYWDIHSALKRR